MTKLTVTLFVLALSLSQFLLGWLACRLVGRLHERKLELPPRVAPTGSARRITVRPATKSKGAL